MQNVPEDDKIVPFPLRLAEADVFAHEDLARLYAAWRQQMLTGEMPKLHAFAPRMLGRWMAYSGVVEVTPGEPVYPGAEPRLRWRLAGSALCKLAGRTLDGTAALEDWYRFERATLRRMLMQLMEQHNPFLAQIRLDGMPGEAQMEVLALPLDDPARGQTVALMVFRPFFDSGRVVPGRLERARLTSLRVLTVGAMEQDGKSREAAEVLPLFTGKSA